MPTSAHKFFPLGLLAFDHALMVVSATFGSEDQAKHPWCRKGAVLAHVPSPTPNGDPGGNKVFLWGGKGHDKVELDHGSSYLGDAWIASVEEANLWSRVPVDVSASPDGRWKSNGDMVDGFFVAFGGDDNFGGNPNYMNDLWVLPMGDIPKNSTRKV